MKISWFNKEEIAKALWLSEKSFLIATDLAIIIILLRSLSIIFQYPWEKSSILVELESIACWIFFSYLLVDFIARVYKNYFIDQSKLVYFLGKSVLSLFKLLTRVKNFWVKRSNYYLTLKLFSQENWYKEKLVLKLASDIWLYQILKKYSLLRIFLEEIAKQLEKVAKESFQFRQVALLLESWEIFSSDEIEEICKEALKDTLLFESINDAREFAQLLYYYAIWDGCNAVKIICYDAVAIKTARELLDIRYCQQGKFCFLI